MARTAFMRRASCTRQRRSTACRSALRRKRGYPCRASFFGGLCGGILLQQRGAVDLAVFVERHRVHLHEEVGNHIARQNLAQRAGDGGLVRLAGVEGENLALVRQIGAQRALHAGDGGHLHLDFAQLDAVPHVLDLEILSGDIDHFAALVDPHEVAGAIDRLDIGAVERVLGEAGGGALRVFIVAQRDGGAADAQLADFAGLDGLAAVRREQQDALVFERHADGERLVFRQTRDPRRNRVQLQVISVGP